ncbi:carbohydrate ABC transporter permease [Kribbella sp. NBC_01245]|uniref:carbohydrate ABC transporter permease n=1 Tax=Kribbella sp. NBC_01245 TaxID=2903578 RepID=UPI002E2C8563|nr:carbohydrate ABC transporter permease [Kribbella sp. NBC_01245]
MSRSYRYAVYIILAAVVLVLLSPIVWLAITSLKSPAEMASFPPTWVPAEPRPDNYVEAVRSVDFLGATRNSLTIAAISTILTTLSSAWVGFGFARLNAPGKKQLFGVLLATMMLPSIVTLVPMYLLFAKVHMVNTFWPWVLWGLAGSPFLIFLFRQFFAGLPREMEEAAVIDGCGYVGIFWRIFLPQSWPVIAASVILSFTAAWGDFVGPALLLSQDSTTLAVAMASGYVNAQGLPLNNLIAAGAVMYVLPVLVLFMFMQRRFVSGFSTAGLK